MVDDVSLPNDDFLKQKYVSRTNKISPEVEIHSLKLTATAPENRPNPQKETQIVFQPSIFRWFHSLASFQGGYEDSPFQWLFLVPLKGGRAYITPQKARTISGI